jgi:hypothetical protein
MSLSPNQHVPSRFAPAFVQSDLCDPVALVALLGDLVIEAPPAPTEGYAFEAAMCLVASQSPLARPAIDEPSPRPCATIELHEALVLSSRTRVLTRLLASVGGHLDAEETRALLAETARVARELIADLGPSAARMSTEPSLGAADRAAAAGALVLASHLAEAVGAVSRHPVGGRSSPGQQPALFGAAPARWLS